MAGFPESFNVLSPPSAVLGATVTMGASLAFQPKTIHSTLTGLRQENRVSLVATCGDFGFGPGMGGADGHVQSQIVPARFLKSSFQT